MSFKRHGEFKRHGMNYFELLDYAWDLNIEDRMTAFEAPIGYRVRLQNGDMGYVVERVSSRSIVVHTEHCPETRLPVARFKDGSVDILSRESGLEIIEPRFKPGMVVGSPAGVPGTVLGTFMGQIGVRITDDLVYQISEESKGLRLVTAGPPISEEVSAGWDVALKGRQSVTSTVICPDCDGKGVASYSPYWLSEPCRTCS